MGMARRRSRKLARLAAAHQVALGVASALFVLAPFASALYGIPPVPSLLSSSASPVTPDAGNDSSGPRTKFTIFDPTSVSPEITLGPADFQKVSCDSSFVAPKGAGVYRCALVFSGGDGAIALDPCFGLRPGEVLCAMTATRMWRFNGVTLRGGGSFTTHQLAAGPAVPWLLSLDNGEKCLVDWIENSSLVKDGPRWICVVPKSLAASRGIKNPEGIPLNIPAYGSPARRYKSTDDPLNYYAGVIQPDKGTVNDYVEDIDYGDGSHWTAKLQIGEDHAKIENHRVVGVSY